MNAQYISIADMLKSDKINIIYIFTYNPKIDKQNIKIKAEKTLTLNKILFLFRINISPQFGHAEAFLETNLLQQEQGFNLFIHHLKMFYLVILENLFNKINFVRQEYL